jgi:membrane-bound lytic murein transglycosylase D
MKKLFLLLALCSGYYSFAQVTVWDELAGGIKSDETVDDEIVGNDEEDRQISYIEPAFEIVIPETWDINFNNLLDSWYVTNHTFKYNHPGYQESFTASDSAYAVRLSQLPNIIEMPYNEAVRQSINVYVERRRSLVEYMLGLECYYFPMIEQTLEKYGMPLELKYLVIVESAMNPRALSRVGASGLWQFMLPTGRQYGLEINSLVDERRCPVQSTDAACRYLLDLYNTYEDWHLALAAYNCGGGNVNRAIRRAGGKKDYWEILPHLPRETRSFVPLFIAANYAMNFYAHHQLYPVQSSIPFATDTVMISQMIHFDQIADVLQLDKEIIRTLNPQYQRDIIPGNNKPQILRLPVIRSFDFAEKEDEIATYRAEELFPNQANVRGSMAANRRERITHTVVRGETLTSIANRYGVTAANLRNWNGLRSNAVAAGRNLTVNIDNGGIPVRTATTANTASATAQRIPASTRADLESIETVRYRIQNGDSYYTIARKFPGFSYSDLMKLNNVTNAALRVGQYILVPSL